MTGGERVFAGGTEIEETVVRSVEGAPTGGTARLRQLLRGERALLVEVRFERGMTIPPHVHDHESYCYCVQGQIRSTVAGCDFVLGPGDAVLREAGVVHSTEALEDSVWIEVKTPPARTW